HQYELKFPLSIFFLLRSYLWTKRTARRNGHLRQRVSASSEYHQVSKLPGRYCSHVIHAHYARNIARDKGAGAGNACATRHAACELLCQSAGPASDSAPFSQPCHSISNGDIERAKNIVAIGFTGRSHRIRNPEGVIRCTVNHHVDCTIV